MNNSILNIKISCFENCQSTVPKEINLLTWLTSEKYREKVVSLRSIQDENLQKVIKASLPAITPSGLFSYRAEKDMIEHSGFLAFDIDFKDNQHITNFDDLKEQVSHIHNVAYCGLSVRGHGFWGLVPIHKSTPEEHKQRFLALATDFKEFGINLDKSGKDVCRLRIYSWDPAAYFNHEAKLYTKQQKPQPSRTGPATISDNREKIESIISQIKASKIDITENYENWLKIGSALENEFGEGGRGYFHAASRFNSNYIASETDRMFDSAMKHNNGKVSIGSFFKIASDYGIKLKPDQSSNHFTPTISINTGKEISEKPLPSPVTTMQKVEKVITPGIWSNEIEELQQFFKSIKLPERIKLDQCSTITDVPLFVETHLSILRAQNGHQRYLPYKERLVLLRSLLNKN